VALESISFFKHVAPYYAPCSVYIITHLLYRYFNGNVAWVLFLSYAYNFPYYKWNAIKPKKENNFDRPTEKLLKDDDRFMGPIYMHVAMDTLTWLWCLCVISGVYPEALPAEWFEDKITGTTGGYFLFVFLFGYLSGVNGLAGHELIHKRNDFDKMLGMTTYTKMLYSHFFLEHGSGHHRNVATPDDAATARKDENFYCFYVRSACLGIYKTWEREPSTLKIKYNREQVPWYVQLTQNRISWFTALHIVILVAILNIFGWRAFIWQLIYSAIGIFFIELINYTEHYGLIRKKDVRGIYEPITEQHSWNAPSSTMLFRIQRHSDHHMHAYRPYQILRKFDNAPFMPYKYMYTLLLALCPPLWYATMNPLLKNKSAEKEDGVRIFFFSVVVSLAYSTYSFI